MRWFEVFFALIPIKVSLRLFGLSTEFINFMIYPRSALPTLDVFIADGCFSHSLALFLGESYH